MKILIVEDEPRVGHFVERGLKQIRLLGSLWGGQSGTLAKGPFDAVILILSAGWRWLSLLRMARYGF
jgi:DNA-binding response OmpR family regulator